MSLCPPGRGGWADLPERQAWRGGSGSPSPVPVGLLRTSRVDPAFQGLKEPLLKPWSNLPLRADCGWFAAGKTNTQRNRERVREQALIPQLQGQLTAFPSVKHQLPEEERHLGSRGQPQERCPPAPSPMHPSGWACGTGWGGLSSPHCLGTRLAPFRAFSEAWTAAA